MNAHRSGASSKYWTCTLCCDGTLSGRYEKTQRLPAPLVVALRVPDSCLNVSVGVLAPSCLLPVVKTVWPPLVVD